MNEPETKTIAPQAEQEDVQQDPANMITEESLAERERQLIEREKAIEQRERTIFINKCLKEKGLPADLSEFIDADNEEKAQSKIERLEEVLRNNGLTFYSQLPDISTGMKHGEPPSWKREESDFVKGLNR